MPTKPTKTPKVVSTSQIPDWPAHVREVTEKQGYTNEAGRAAGLNKFGPKQKNVKK